MDNEQKKAPEKASPPQQPAAATKAPGKSVLQGVKGTYPVNPEKHLPEYSSLNVKAYEATVEGDKSTKSFVLICPKEHSPRISVLKAAQNYTEKGLMRPIDWGRIAWKDGREYLGIAFEQPLGGRVLEDLNKTMPPLSEKDVIDFVKECALPTLNFLQKNQITHRRINPTNLYYADEKKKKILIGEAYSNYAGFAQPALFESIESSMCEPYGRGPGTVQNDLYSLGVTILFLVLGHNPLIKKPGSNDEAVATPAEDDVLYDRLQKGTVSAYLANNPVSATIGTLVKGLLHDVAEERWTLQQLSDWISGKNIVAKEQKLRGVTAKAIEYSGREHYALRSLIHAFAQTPGKAAEVMRSEELDSWMQERLHQIGSPITLSDATKPLKIPGALGASGSEIKVSKLCMYIDPVSPIRYKGMNLFPGGLAGCLVECHKNGEKKQTINEIISQNLIPDWKTINGKNKTKSGVKIVDRIFNKLEQFLKYPGLGYGIERCLYQLNPYIACQSRIFDKHYVASLKDILPALEDVSKGKNKKDLFFDRHIAAFIMARAKDVPQQTVKELGNNNDISANLVGALRLLSYIQDAYHPRQKFTGITSWLSKHTDPIIESYHNRNRRRNLRKKVDSIASQGHIKPFIDILDNPLERENDSREFFAVRQKFSALDQSLSRLRNQEKALKSHKHPLENTITVLTSALIMFLALMFTFKEYFLS